MGKLGDFFDSYQWKRINGAAYGIGASLVITGALFKIMHWPAGGIMLSIGMFTEAILFAISAIDKPHKTFDWGIVFPQLGSGDGKASRDDAASASAGLNLSALSAGGGSAKLPSLETAALSEEDVQKLSDNIKKLTDTAGQLASVTSASEVTEKYIKNVSSASDAVGSFSNAQRSLTESSSVLVDSFKGFASNMSAVSNDSKLFMEKISTLNQTLASVNSTYELQLKNAGAQEEAFSAVNTSLDKISAAMDSSVREAEAYKEQTAKLTQQVSNLNNIYGNMLNAMNVRA